MEIAITIAICWVAFALGIALFAVGVEFADLCDSKSKFYMRRTSLLDKQLEKQKCPQCGR